MKVEQFYNKNQFVIRGENKTVFQSYNSEIAEINNDTGKLKLGCDWDYSKTTTKHLYLFLNDFKRILNYETREEIDNLNTVSNKRAYIQKLIDSKVIEYDENMI